MMIVKRESMDNERKREILNEEGNQFKGKNKMNKENFQMNSAIKNMAPSFF
jgi:hypothetical protein